MKIELELPDWVEERSINILAGIELVAKKYPGQPWQVKTSRCISCGKCCIRIEKYEDGTRGPCEHLKEDGNKYVYLSIGLVFLALLAFMYIPGFQTTFAEMGYNFCLMYLNALDWVICIAVAMICTLSFEAVKFYARMKGIVF